MSAPRYICIHGHFYQPPRENPWLEEVERQDSAHPYHDWNERITAECYAANAHARILDDKNCIVRIVNNYERISFNFGPTLLSWLERQAPDVYDSILVADKKSQEIFSGHGSALAQVYNHMIMPLANLRDKKTQIIWGMNDFRHRFGRQPEGVWLPEAAVDLGTLEILAEQGINFTILAPHQIKRVRTQGDPAWQDVAAETVDGTVPYRVNLPSGKAISVFVYDGPLSRAVAFERLLSTGEGFARRLLGALRIPANAAQLVHIATDGESYGHHHQFGEMALADALDRIATGTLARLTNYGEYLERHPPTREAEIVENTAWSCSHGVGRWRDDCGCNVGNHPGWNQAWRGPLRAALDWLRHLAAPRFEESASALLRDPWGARDGYIQVILDRSEASRARFLAEHATRTLSQDERTRALKLLEMQRHLQLMYTSCGWFFDDPSGIETIAILQYAARAVQLARDVWNVDWEPEFRERLSRAQSNVAEAGDVGRIYQTKVRSAVVDLATVCAHAAVESLLSPPSERDATWCYSVQRVDHRDLQIGTMRVALGHAAVSSVITEDVASFDYGATLDEQGALRAGVREAATETEYEEFRGEVERARSRADSSGAIAALERHLNGLSHTLASLRPDERDFAAGRILAATLPESAVTDNALSDQTQELLRLLADTGSSSADKPTDIASIALEVRLGRFLADPDPDWQRVGALLKGADSAGVHLDRPAIAYRIQPAAVRALRRRLGPEPGEVPNLQVAIALIAQIQALPIAINIRGMQDLFYDLLQTVYPVVSEHADRGDAAARTWVDQCAILGAKLSVRVG